MMNPLSTNEIRQLYDCLETQMGLERKAIAIAKERNFFIPSLFPFCKGRALFFCSSMYEAIRIAKRVSIETAITTVYLNNYHSLVNVIETNFSRFRGSASVKELPFDFWCMKIFETIASPCGGLLENDRKH